MLDLLGKVALSLALGAILGWERSRAKRSAGFKTFMMVIVGSCLFTYVGVVVFVATKADPLRMASAVITGLGFIGAGVIMRRGASVEGVTTAAQIWFAGAVGVMIGVNLMVEAVVVTGMALIASFVFRWVEEKLGYK